MKRISYLFALIITTALASCQCGPLEEEETVTSDENVTWITGEGDTIVE